MQSTHQNPGRPVWWALLMTAQVALFGLVALAAPPRLVLPLLGTLAGFFFLGAALLVPAQRRLFLVLAALVGVGAMVAMAAAS